MAFTNQKTRAIVAGTMLILSQFLATVPVVSAQSTANATTKCDEGVHPFMPGKTELTGSTADSLAINFPGETHCDNSLTGSFPNNQHEDPNAATHNPKSTNYTVPKALHEHHYINESVSTDGYYKRAWLKTFKIKLQSDLKGVLKDGTLKCPIPNDGNSSHYDTNFGNCPANYTNAKVFGGTKLQFDGTTLTYTFGLNQPVEDPPGSGVWFVKPLIPGKNDSGEMPGTTGSWLSRHFGMAIDFETKDMSPDTAWSATSTSQAEIIHTAIPKATFNAVPGGLTVKESNKGKYHACTEGGVWNASNSWCNIGGYQWANIGTVATVWKPEVIPPPPVCTSVTLTPGQLNATGSTSLTAKVNLSSGTATANVKWSSTGGTLSTTSQTGPTSANFLNNFTLTGATGSVKVWVDSLVGATNSPACQNGKEIDTPPPACTDLTINPTGPFNESQLPQTITVTSTTTGGLTLDYRWTSSAPGLINFDGNPPTYYDSNTTTALTRTGAITAPVTVTVTAVNKTNHAQVFAGVCQKTLTITPPPKPYCEKVVLNKTTISNSGSDTVSATVTYNDGKSRQTTLTWTPVNLTLSPPTNPETHSSLTAFTKTTNPVVPGNPVSVNAKVTGIIPLVTDTLGVDNSPACLAGVTASSGGGNVCQSLNNSGYTGTTVAGGTTVLFAPNPTNNTPPPPPFVTWTESGAGVLIRNPASPFPFNQNFMCPAAMNDKTIPLPRGCQYFYQTPSTTGTSGFVTITANPNLGNVAACTQTTTFNNQPQQNVCTGLTYTQQPNGYTCVSPIGTFSGQYQWTINGNTFTNGTCQTVPKNSSVHVEGVGAPQCAVNIPPQTPPCQYVTPNYNGSQLCLTVNPSSYTGPFTWKIGSGLPFSNGLCQNVAPNTFVNITGPNPACSLNNYLTPPNPPRLQKTVRAMNPPESSQGKKGGSVPLTLVPNIEGKIVEYELVFTPTSPNTTATIVDDMSKGYIQGKTNTGSDGGRIVYNDKMNVTGVPACTSVIKTNCYSGDIGTPGGITLVKVNSQVRITYQGKVAGSKLTEANCQDNNSPICQEKYPNTATANYQIYESPAEDAKIISTGGPLSAIALVQSFCQYILTRAAGDIYLETDLNFGKDIYLCSEYRSSTGLIVTPGETPDQITPSTGGTTVPIGHEICSQGQAGGILPADLEKLYGKDAVSKYLSSQICEVKLRPGESWSKSTITSNIKENKTRVSRWEPNLNNYGNLITTFDDSGLPATNTGVYHLTNNDLTLGGGSDLVLADGQGAKTFIVENHDLIIKNNIKYGPCPDGSCTVRETASLAFIVLNGNVIVDPGVTEISGVYFVQQGDDTESGRLKASGDSYTKLTIFGSVYGDIQDLFTHHKFAGDPAANEGSVVIRFDERIILNTPPGLQDILQLSQSEVAR